MNTKQEDLAKRLLYLSLDLHEKVLLWLTYKGLKPVSEILVERRNYPVLHRMIFDKKFKDSYVSDYDYSSAKTKKIRKWLRDAGLYKVMETKSGISWHVGKDRLKVELSAKIIRKFDYENECKSGFLFGFPKESAKAYAYNRMEDFKDNQIPMVRHGDLVHDPYLKDKYYVPYIFFSMRKDRVKEDSKVAKKWADTIRKDVPTLAKWFEKDEARKKKKSSKTKKI